MAASDDTALRFVAQQLQAAPESGPVCGLYSRLPLALVPATEATVAVECFKRDRAALLLKNAVFEACTDGCWRQWTSLRDRPEQFFRALRQMAVAALESTAGRRAVRTPRDADAILERARNAGVEGTLPGEPFVHALLSGTARQLPPVLHALRQWFPAGNPVFEFDRCLNQWLAAYRYRVSKAANAGENLELAISRIGSDLVPGVQMDAFGDPRTWVAREDLSDVVTTLRTIEREAADPRLAADAAAAVEAQRGFPFMTGAKLRDHQDGPGQQLLVFVLEQQVNMFLHYAAWVRLQSVH